MPTVEPLLTVPPAVEHRNAIGNVFEPTRHARIRLSLAVLAVTLFACSTPPVEPVASPADDAMDVHGADDAVDTVDSEVGIDAKPDVDVPVDTVSICLNLNCDDDNACTTDQCDESVGCLNLPTGTGTPCAHPCFTSPICANGQCIDASTAAPCEDGQACTIDACDLPMGCTHTLLPEGATCEDGDACTIGETCNFASGCTGGIDIICSNGDVCVSGTCQSEKCALPAKPLPGEFGAVCTTGNDCDAGYCLNTPNGEICTQDCTNNCCPGGWACLNISPTMDPWYGCTPKLIHTCDPCSDDSQCQSPGDPAGLCLSYGNAGNFCGGTCMTDPDCPGGYFCKKGAKGTAGIGNQCVKKNSVCDCSAVAMTLGLTTNCTNTTKFGTCAGTRTCTSSGLTACNAPAASAEVCNGIDDNCDGATDEVGSSGCTNWFADKDGDGYGTGTGSCVCSKPAGAFASQNGDCNDTLASVHPGATPFCSGFDGNCDGVLDVVPCDDGDPCTLDGCAFVLGTCTHKTLPSCLLGCKSNNDPSCNDGDPCTDDTCVNGGCVHAVGIGCACTASCDDGDVCTTDGCDKTTGKCAHGIISDCCDGSALYDCDDGYPCTQDSCNPATNQCKHIANCDDCMNDNNCDDGNVCTIDNCGFSSAIGAKLCMHEKVEPCCNLNTECDDNDACTTDFCDVPINTCKHTPVPGCCNTSDAITMCNDGKICTIDTCNPMTHKCVSLVDEALGSPCCTADSQCDDSNGCTTDTCSFGFCDHTPPLGMNPLPNACTPSLCDDGNPCTTDGCGCTGYCENAPIAGCTLPCDVTNCSPVGTCFLQSCDLTGQCVKADACNMQKCLSGFDCYDGDGCTADICTASGCVFKVLTCDDANSCTLDACLGGTCGHVFMPGCVVPKAP
jgi:hypothetical protein